MDHFAKIKILKQLARTSEDNAKTALEKEAQKIQSVLLKETQFDLLKDQVEYLDILAVRIDTMVLRIIKKFLVRLKTIKLTHQGGAEQWGAESVAKFETNDKLVINLLEVVARIRYLNMKEVLSIFVGYSCHENHEVRKIVKECLESAARYNIKVFHGTETQLGIGPTPQIEILDWLEGQNCKELNANSVATINLCKNMLSPNMEATTWNYTTVSWSSGPVPATNEIRGIRSRSVNLLRALYSMSTAIADKKTIIRAMLTATQSPYHSDYNDDHLAMIAENTLEILAFFDERLPNEPLQIIEMVEHETFWVFKRTLNGDVKSKALNIRNSLSERNEYKIFKTLIGFEGVFDEWEETDSESGRIREIDDLRSAKSKEYAESINSDNWPEWRERILMFVKVESNDLATFPKFFEFLQFFAARSPDLAFALLNDDFSEIDDFTVPLLKELWKGNRKEDLRSLMVGWIEAGRQLKSITKFFWSNDDVDRELVQLIFKRGVKDSNRELLISLVGVVVSNYSDDCTDLVDSLFIPILQELTLLKDTRWIHEFWFQQKGKMLLNELSEDAQAIILKNLVMEKNIDYQMETILVPLTENDPERTMEFFGQRIQYKSKLDSGNNYRSIPFELDKLNNILATFPKIVLKEVRSWYEKDDYLFQYRGGRLPSIVFPQFGEEFEAELLELISMNDKLNIKFVLQVLSNYEGQTFLHNVCRKIVASLSNDDELLAYVSIVLRNTGVVSGEFGFAEAYECKIEEVKGWLHDDNKAVSDFASQYISTLTEEIEAERLRAEETIVLQKHAFGPR